MSENSNRSWVVWLLVALAVIAEAQQKLARKEKS